MTIKKRAAGLFGFGTVGAGVYELINAYPAAQIIIKKICVKDTTKSRNASAGLFTTEAGDILNDDEITTVIELIDDAQAAYEIVTAALKKGKDVISANKKMIATHLPELIELQQRHGGTLLYEAAVAGSIPIIRSLEEYYYSNGLTSVRGIINGSTNYILTKMCNENLVYATALTQAKKSGFAESDPRLDVEGFDAQNKLTILLKHAFGVNVQPGQLLRKGIIAINAEDLEYANFQNKKIKLVATAKLIDDKNLAAFILPEFLDNDDPLSAVRNEFNGLQLGSRIDEQFLQGKGAGRYPTASAVFNDLSSSADGYRYQYRKSKQQPAYQLSNAYTIKIYVSFESGQPSPEDDFDVVDDTYQGRDRSFIIGFITQSKLLTSNWLFDAGYSVVYCGEVHGSKCMEAELHQAKLHEELAA